MRSLVTLLIAAFIASASGATRAADIAVPRKAPPPATSAYSWTGFYVGAWAGYLWGRKDWLEIVGPVPGGIIHPSYDGFVGGGTVGFNYQVSNVVFGVEGDWGLTNARGSTGCISTAALGCGVELKWIATLTGRLGVTWDRALIYVKGGGAWVEEDYPVGVGSPFAFTLNHTRDGWTFGGGVEYGLTPNWSAKIEYNYFDFGTDRLNFRGAIEDITQRSHVIRAGLNYRFGWDSPIMARY